MTRALPFTEFSLRRAIKAARKEGLAVTGIRPDGTLVLSDGENPGEDISIAGPQGHHGLPSKWDDVKA